MSLTKPDGSNPSIISNFNIIYRNNIKLNNLIFLYNSNLNLYYSLIIDKFL